MAIVHQTFSPFGKEKRAKNRYFILFLYKYRSRAMKYQPRADSLSNLIDGYCFKLFQTTLQSRWNFPIEACKRIVLTSHVLLILKPLCILVCSLFSTIQPGLVNHSGHYLCYFSRKISCLRYQFVFSATNC